MRSLLVGVVLLGLGTSARAQPAHCPELPASGPTMQIGIDLAGRPGVPAGTTGKAYVPVPMQAPRSDCGEASVPADVLHGEPGDLLRGTPAPDRR